jgi:hypothetical protein
MTVNLFPNGSRIGPALDVDQPAPRGQRRLAPYPPLMIPFAMVGTLPPSLFELPRAFASPGRGDDGYLRNTAMVRLAKLSRSEITETK